MRGATLTVLGFAASAVLGQGTSGTSAVSASCLHFDGLSFYDVRSLKSDQDLVLTDSTNAKYYFNLCSYPQVNQCDPTRAATSFAYLVDGETCKPLTDNEVSPMGTDGNSVVFAFPSRKNATCTVEGQAAQPYQLTIKVECDSEHNTTIPQAVDTTDPCKPVLTVTSPKACPAFSASGFSQFFIQRPGILGFVAVVFGIIIAVYGRRFFPKTILGTGTLVGFGITLLLFTVLSMLESQQLSFLASLMQYVMSLAVGLFLGFILQRMLKIAAAIFGAIGGYFIAAALFAGWIENEYLLTALLVIVSAGTAALSTRYYDEIVIFSTSVFGSFCFIHGFSLIVDKNASVYSQILSGDFNTMMYVYLSLLVLTTSFGSFYQLKQRSAEVKFEIN